MLFRKFEILVVVSAFCLGLSGCGDKEKDTAVTTDSYALDLETADTVDPAIGAAVIDSELLESGIVVQVGDKAISLVELDKEVGSMLTRMGGSMPGESAESVKMALRSQTLDHMVNQAILLAEALKQDLAVDESEVAAKINEVKTGWPDPAGFDEHLETIGMDKEKLARLIRESLLIESLLAKEIPAEGHDPGDEEIAAYYESNPEAFQVPEKVRASHVLLKVGSGDGADERTGQLEKLRTVLEEIRTGRDFAELAGEFSDCPSRTKGGDLGFFGRGQMVKPFEQAAFNLEVDEVSDIVETDFGYHIIKVTAKSDARTLPLEEVRDKVSANLSWRTRADMLRLYIDKLRNGISITYAPGYEPPAGIEHPAGG